MSNPIVVSEVAEEAMRALRKGSQEQEKWVFDPRAFEAFSARVLALPKGADSAPHVVDLGLLAAHLIRQACPRSAQQLLAVVEPLAGAVLADDKAREVAKSEERVAELGKKFESFLGSQGEQLPDTGERLDPKPYKGPIRG